MKGIYPSLISADLLNLKNEVERLEPYCAGFHIDIMDNHFVPNLTWGASFVQAIGMVTNKQMWVHIMVDNPDDWVKKLKMPADSILSFHAEATDCPEDIINYIAAKKWQPSLAVSPKTPINSIFNLLPNVKQVLLMSVEPGFSGQKFIQETVTKLEELDTHRKKNNLYFKIGMDGGINKTNIQMLAQKGVDDFAIASGIFDHSNTVQALEELNKLIT